MPSIDTGRLPAGFADPVLDAQAVFRRLLTAFSYVGRIQDVARAPAAPAPLVPAAGAVILALADFETPVWLDAAASGSLASSWLRFHCGVRVVEEPGQALFALATDGATMPPLDRFHPGSELYPERSCTVIVQVADLGRGERLRLSGPGIDGATDLSVAGLPPWFLHCWAANRALYPTGVDVVLAAGRRIAALPRGTKIEG